MTEKTSIEECRSLAKRAGLNLGEEELERLRPGIDRARRQAAELRQIIDANAEPVLTFTAARATGK